ncbi:MAG: hypothetical protein L6Q95_03885 [Planctomycetes bacterium]|nr:hypothetical protein [Planctomycetota bacterium]
MRALVLLLLAGAAFADGGNGLGSLIRWYLREESPVRRQDLLETIERLADGDCKVVAEAIRKGEHFERPERPALKKGGKPPAFDPKRPRLQPVEECAGDYADLVLPEGYTPSRAHPLILELAPLGLPPPEGTLLLRIRVGAHPQAKASAEAADLLVMSLLAHAFEVVNVDPDRVFLFAGEREEAALAWCIALHNPDRFAGVLAGPGGWREGLPLAPNAALFAGLGIVSHKGDRAADGFLAELRKFNAAHVRLESTGDPGQNAALLGPEIARWWGRAVRPPAPRRIRLVDDRGMPLRAYWLRLAPRVPSLKQDEVGRTWKQSVLAQDAVLEAEIASKDLVIVHAERVAAFDLCIDPALFDPGGVVRVSVNGQVPEARVVRGDIGALLEDYRERRDPAVVAWGKLTFTAR